MIVEWTTKGKNGLSVCHVAVKDVSEKDTWQWPLAPMGCPRAS